jgi:hypothetical protein
LRMPGVGKAVLGGMEGSVRVNRELEWEKGEEEK